MQRAITNRACFTTEAVADPFDWPLDKPANNLPTVLTINTADSMLRAAIQRLEANHDPQSVA